MNKNINPFTTPTTSKPSSVEDITPQGSSETIKVNAEFSNEPTFNMTPRQPEAKEVEPSFVNTDGEKVWVRAVDSDMETTQTQERRVAAQVGIEEKHMVFNTDPNLSEEERIDMQNHNSKAYDGIKVNPTVEKFAQQERGKENITFKRAEGHDRPKSSLQLSKSNINKPSQYE